MENQWIIPLLILKTAGTTLLKILERQYKKDNILLLNEPLSQSFADRLKQLSKTQREKIRYVRGPVYFGVHEVLPQPCTYITMLREPVDRIISYYYHLRKDTNNELHNYIISRQMSLKDFVSSGLTVELENGQTRALSGMKESYKDGFRQQSDEILEKAKKNLKEHCAVVGLTERFNETLVLLKKAFGWKNTFYVKRNVSATRLKNEDIPKETLDIIKKKNELDIELYKYAQERFDELIQKQGPLFERELITFQSLNELYCKFYGNHYMSLYGFMRPITTGFRQWLKAGRVVCLTIISTSLFQGIFLVLDDII